MFTSKFVVGAIVAFAFLIQVAVGEGSGMICMYIHCLLYAMKTLML